MDATIIAQPEPDKLKVLQHQQYETAEHLTPATAPANPLDLFRAWFREAVEKKVHEPDAVTLATATAKGVPSARVVLFKEADGRGFIFFTNYTSRKSQELTENPHAAMAFYWREIHRSVRVVGRAERMTAEENEAYFKSRPVESQLGAWASRQSTVIDEGVLEERLKKATEKFGSDVPTPAFWGGWRIIPDEVEFWLGKPARLHDRIHYARTEANDWRVERLSP
ncbi:pyridoxamine 5'-phosphate oxidase [Ephemerocybe angulata]|uniref:pyridoxal 5'-phosphate synthase n=1 Tax=Ephemerocybe angulata TaxID=980116 RepID=A0A8H6I2K1_9AGAR|nr:pyridoxamine 5'-phosphate oxidase [Tulosesus angulatus]